MPKTELKAKSVSINRNVIGKKDGFGRGTSVYVNSTKNDLPGGTENQILRFDDVNGWEATSYVTVSDDNVNIHNDGVSVSGDTIVDIESDGTLELISSTRMDIASGTDIYITTDTGKIDANANTEIILFTGTHSSRGLAILETNGGFANIPVDTANFDNNLSNLDDTLQKCLETLDEMSTGGLPTGMENQTLRHNATGWVSNSDLQIIDNIDDGKIIKLYNTIETYENQFYIKSYADLGNDITRCEISGGQILNIDTKVIDLEYDASQINFTSNCKNSSIDKSMTTLLHKQPNGIDSEGFLIQSYSQFENKGFEVGQNSAIKSDFLLPANSGRLNNLVSDAGTITKELLNLRYSDYDLLISGTTLSNSLEHYVKLTENNVYKIECFLSLKFNGAEILRDGFKIGFSDIDTYIGYCSQEFNIIVVPSGVAYDEDDIFPIEIPLGSAITIKRRVTNLNNVNPIVYNLYNSYSFVNDTDYPPPHYCFLHLYFLVQSNSTQNFYLKIAKERDNGDDLNLMLGSWIKATLQSGF